MLILAHRKGAVSVWFHVKLDIGVIYGHDGNIAFKGTKSEAMKKFLFITNDGA